MTILAFLIMGIFFYGIRYVSKIDTTTYDIAEGSIVYNDDFQLIETRDHTKLKRSYDSNYYLTTIEEDYLPNIRLDNQRLFIIKQIIKCIYMEYSTK